MVAIKVCGITSVSDGLLAAQHGASYLGYILNYSASPRRLTAADAANIITAVRASFPQVQHVGVTVDLQAETINDLVRRLRLDVVQLHGNESLATVQAVRAPRIWKSGIIRTPADSDRLADYIPYVQGVHLDAGRGSGQTIPPELLETALRPLQHYNQQHPDQGVDVIVAGGITPDTIHHMLAYHPTIVDVNSGVESQPGKKDPQLLQRFFQQLYVVA